MTSIEIDYERIIESVTANIAGLLGKEAEAPAKPKKIRKGKRPPKKSGPGLEYDFSDVLYDPKNIRTIQERTSPEWAKKIEYFLRLFQKYDEPITIHPSVKYDTDPNMRPMVATMFPQNVNSVASDLHVLLQKGRSGVRTWAHHLIFGLSVPSLSDREEGTRYMRGALSLSAAKEFNKELGKLLKSNRAAIKVKDVRKEIGTSYEQQLEYYFYMSGFHTYHNGLIKKYDDKGVDLLLIKNGETHLVQAKAWGRNKKISPHDAEVIFRKMEDWYNNNKVANKEVVGPLKRILLVVANGDCLPEETRLKCTELGMVFKIVPFEDDWKKTKCIIAKNGDKIYYTPDHGAWKKLDMHTDKRRFWATEQEAKAKEYRLPGGKKK